MAYLPPVFEIWRDLGRFFCISFYCVSVVSLHIESTDSMIVSCFSLSVHLILNSVNVSQLIFSIKTLSTSLH